MIHQAPKTKYQHIRDILEEDIRSGRMEAGHQLPSEIVIAEKHNVSLMTARRAVSDLVAADLLERRGRKGTFVRQRTRDRLNKVTVNLIGSAYDNFMQSDFFSTGVRAIEAEGWHAKIIRLIEGQQDAAVIALASGQPTILNIDDVVPNSSLDHAVRSAKSRVVTLGPDLSSLGVPHVAAPLRDIVLKAWQRLSQDAPGEIAIVAQFPSDDVDPSRVISWQRDFSAMYDSLNVPLKLVKVRVPIFHTPTQQAYETTRAFLAASPNVTGLISMGDEMTVGILAACRDSDRDVPKDIAIINIGNSPLMKFSVPSVTCIDVDYVNQIATAIAIVKANLAGGYEGSLVNYTPTHLIERESVRNRMADLSVDTQALSLISERAFDELLKQPA